MPLLSDYSEALLALYNDGHRDKQKDEKYD
jgi:hypothetical protein